MSILAPLTDDQHEAISTLVEEEIFDDKELIMREVDLADCLYFLRVGEVVAYKHVEAGSEASGGLGKEVGRMQAGAVIGESALQGGDSHRMVSGVDE